MRSCSRNLTSSGPIGRARSWKATRSNHTATWSTTSRNSTRHTFTTAWSTSHPPWNSKPSESTKIWSVTLLINSNSCSRLTTITLTLHPLKNQNPDSSVKSVRPKFVKSISRWSRNNSLMMLTCEKVCWGKCTWAWRMITLSFSPRIRTKFFSSSSM